MQYDYTINIARVISDEVQRFIDWERISRTERMGTLRFPTLITALCQTHGVYVEPRMKIRASIEKKFIDHYCTNQEENPDTRDMAPSPPRSPSSPTLEVVEKRVNRVLYVGVIAYLSRTTGQRYSGTFLRPKELSSFFNWPGTGLVQWKEWIKKRMQQNTTQQGRKMQ